MNRFQILKQSKDFTPCYTPVLPPQIPPRKDFNRQQQQELISELLQTTTGRQRLAEAMAQPLRGPLDYPSIGTFQVQSTPVFIGCSMTVS